MKANIRNALIVTVLAMMAMSIPACFSDSSAGGGNNDELEARVADLEELVGAMEDRIAELEGKTSAATLRVAGVNSGSTRTGAKDSHLQVIGEVISHLPGSASFGDSNSYEAISTEGYLFDIRITDQDIPVAIGYDMDLRYESSDCTGPAYVRTVDIGQGAVRQGYVWRKRTDADPNGNDPANYMYIEAGADWVDMTALSRWDASQRSCEQPPGPNDYEAYPVLPNDSAITGIQSEPFQGPTYLGPNPNAGN